MSLTPIPQAANPVSKVSFRPVSDGKTDALIVTIKTVVPEVAENINVMEVPKKNGLAEPKRKTRSSRTSASKSTTKSTNTEESQKISLASQTSIETPNTSTTEHVSSEPGPCLKHAAENIARKASRIPSEKVSLCNNCSKSMLSYIFVVQDFLESLTKEICGNGDPTDCVQCLRQEARRSLASYADENSTETAREKVSCKSLIQIGDQGPRPESSKRENSRSGKTPNRTKETPREVRKYEESAEVLIQRAISRHGQSTNQQNQTTDFAHCAQYLPSPHLDVKETHTYGQGNGQTLCQGENVHQRYSDGSAQQERHQEILGKNAQQERHEKRVGGSVQERLQEHLNGKGQPERQQETPDGNGQQEYKEHIDGTGERRSQVHDIGTTEQIHPTMSHREQSSTPYQGGTPQSHKTSEHAIFLKPMERQQPDFTDHKSHHQDLPRDPDRRDFRPLESISPPFGAEVDGIISTLSNAEREVYDAARNGAGWDSLTEPQERLVPSSTNQIPSEAFVTMCRNNAEALGCLVVGTSLLLCRTTRTLCVLVSDGVSNAFRGSLSSVFHVVQCVRAMDSLGTTKLALLEQPELGISFEKLNVWRLVQFNRCVFLNPDTLVIQNCDELFGFDELSAVPDIGWPDCFNSGVFVFVPSIQTFWQLLEFAEKQGSYDGGDQGLLNSYYNNWSDDITKKLSFIYNLMANVSYTYTPAFKQFGRNVKIVQFHGSFKPWHVKYFSRTGQISPASSVHPTYVQFVNIWINIFRISALRQLNQEIQLYAQSQEVICAVELLRFFPLPTESEADFYLTPPSVRLRLAERKFQRTLKTAENIQRRKSAEFSHARNRDESVNIPAKQPKNVRDRDESADIPAEQPKDAKAEEITSKADSPSPFAATGSTEPIFTTTDRVENDSEAETATEKTVLETDDAKAATEKIVADKNILPGSEVGNYQGMKAWEQGRMDYQGTDSSDNILKRLEFLMAKPN